MASKPPKNRTKTPTVPAMQTRQEVQKGIYQIGVLQREHNRLSGELNDRVAQMTADVAPRLKDLQEQMGALHKTVQVWCEAHRDELCGKAKSANLVTGEVQWRVRPPSVRVVGLDAVIAWLKRAGMHGFLRVKEEVNKEAMLNEPDKAQQVPGVCVVSGQEDFAVLPYEVDTEGSANG